MTPKEAAIEFDSINLFAGDPSNCAKIPACRTGQMNMPERYELTPSAQAIFRSRCHNLSKLQNSWDAYEWTEYSIEHQRIGNERRNK